MGKKAFTLIELIVVVAVVGILVLLGAPRFIGQTQRAELAGIRHDIKVMEQEIGTELINKYDDFTKWENNNKDFNQLIQEGNLFEKEGVAKEVEDLSIDEAYKVIPEKYKDKINTKLKGTFYANSDGKVYYEHEKSLSENPTEPEKGIDIPEYYVEATDDDFLKVDDEWSSPNGAYYYLYTGDEDYVIVPEKIHGDVITDTYHMFGDYYFRDKGIYTESKVKGVAMDNPNITNTSEMFFGSVADSIELDYLNTENVTNMTKMFAGTSASLDLSNFDTSNAKTLSGMFFNSRAPELDLSNFNTHNVTDMSFLFEGARATIINVENLDTSNVTNMMGMFQGTSASLDLSNFDTSKVNTMKAMFSRSQATDIDLSSFDTSNVTDMERMFSNSAFETLNLSMFDTRKVTTMAEMFLASQATDIDLSSFDTSNVTNMERMFQETKAPTLDLSSFDLTNVAFNWMFTATETTTIYARTESDAEIMSRYFSGKPSSAVVIVKD